MFTLLALFFFLFGIAIGSFLNVVILRYNTGFGVEGRSQCFSCGKTLRWFELIPILSFLALRGKCARCKSRISWQYPLVEFFTGCAFLAVFYKYWYLVHFSFASFAVALTYGVLMFSLLIVIFVYDLRHKIIPDMLVVLLGILTFSRLFIDTTTYLSFHIPTWQDFLAGPILAAPFALIWLISKGMWMGLGDAKLTLSFGWALGIGYGLSAVVLSFWIGAVVGMYLLLQSRNGLTMKSEIPFAPFLIIGFLIVYFFSIDVLNISQFIS